MRFMLTSLAEPALEILILDALEDDWDEQTPAATRTTTSPSSSSARRGDVPMTGIGELSPWAMVVPVVNTCILRRLERGGCELRSTGREERMGKKGGRVSVYMVGWLVGPGVILHALTDCGLG